MALTSVTAAAHDPGRVVLLTVSGVPAGPLVATAFPAAGASYRVRATWSPSGADNVALDGDVPFGVATSYTVTDGTSTVSSAAVTVTSDHAVLADATTPTLAVTVTVLDQLPNMWEARSVWWDVLGARAPFASLAPLRFRNGDLVLWCADRTEREAVISLLSTGVPFTLRTPCGAAVDDVIGLPQSITEQLVVAADKAGARTVTLTYQAIARELGAFLGDATRTYATLLTDSATYGDVVTDFRRYADVLSGVSA